MNKKEVWKYLILTLLMIMLIPNMVLAKDIKDGDDTALARIVMFLLHRDDENNDTLFFLGQYDDFDTIQATTALLATAKLFDDYLKANNLTIRKK